MDILQEDTIAAIASPEGRGAIGIVRISGPKTEQILSKIFHPKKPDVQRLSHVMMRGEIRDDLETIDDVLAVYFRQGASYTGDAMAEIYAHGNPLILSNILMLIQRSGARLAEPGEFTFRSYMNGKIDLAQAEAVNDLIEAQSQWAIQVAHHQLKGDFSKEMIYLREMLLEMLAHTEAAISFPGTDAGAQRVSRCSHACARNPWCFPNTPRAS